MRSTTVIMGILLMVFGCSRPNPGISGRIENLADGTSLYLCVYEGVLRTMDSTVSVGGGFGFGMPQIMPNILYLRIGNREATIVPLFVEGIPVEIVGDITNPHRIRAQGTESNELLAAYRSSIEDFEIQLRAIEVAMGLPGAQLEELSTKRDSIELIITAKKVAFIIGNNHSIVAAFLASTMVDSTTSRGRINHLIALLDTTSMTDNTFLRRLRRLATAR